MDCISACCRFVVGATWGLAALLSAGQAARAQQFVWSEWETAAVERGGPKVADGLLVYLHGRGIPDAEKLPVLDIFIEMAKTANWDILKINRLDYIDEQSQDEELRQFIGMEIDKARRDGYRHVIVAGGSRGGWLALLSASLDGVDGVIALAPGTADMEVLVPWLSKAKARRIAAFFFEGDPAEAAAESRADASRRALEQGQSTFMLVDRPPGLIGHSAAATGRFIRRYRDCLVQFMRTDDLSPGEAQCPQDRGYAIGADIGFPADDIPIKVSRSPDKALAPYAGRWQGDNLGGEYVIMEPSQVDGDRIAFRLGYSPSPGHKRSRRWIGDLPFALRGDGLVGSIPGTSWILTAHVSSPAELLLEFALEDGKPLRRFVLSRHSVKYRLGP